MGRLWMPLSFVVLSAFYGGAALLAVDAPDSLTAHIFNMCLFTAIGVVVLGLLASFVRRRGD